MWFCLLFSGFYGPRPATSPELWDSSSSLNTLGHTPIQKLPTSKSFSELTAVGAGVHSSPGRGQLTSPEGSDFPCTPSGRGPVTLTDLDGDAEVASFAKLATPTTLSMTGEGAELTMPTTPATMTTQVRRPRPGPGAGEV